MSGIRGAVAVDWEQYIGVKRTCKKRKDHVLSWVRNAGLGNMLLIDDPNIWYMTRLAMIGESSANHYSLFSGDGTTVH